MPNRERIYKWVQALESGQYDQIEGSLRIKDKYCCLGVACEVAIQNGLHLTISEEDDITGEYSYDSEVGELPESVRAWYDFGDHNPSLLTDAQADEHIDAPTVSAAEANDVHNQSFADIARLVRNTYLT